MLNLLTLVLLHFLGDTAQYCGRKLKLQDAYGSGSEIRILGILVDKKGQYSVEST